MNIAAVGQFIKAQRKKYSLTQGDIAEFIGVSTQAVSKWERGENLPDAGFFTDLAQILQTSIEDILRAGASLETRNQRPETRKAVEDEVFDRIIYRLKSFESAGDIDMDLDFFAYLTGQQKMDFIKALLTLVGFGIVLDEILPYTANTHKAAIVSHVLKNREYEELEQLMPLISNELKTGILEKLLAEERFDVIEEIITAFNRRQRDMIVDCFLAGGEYFDEIDNFVPFFDKKQIEKLLGGE